MHNGNLTVSTTTYNSTAIYTCSSGYDIHGPNSIRCLATGDWDKLEAKCTIKVLQNGFHNATTTTYNSTAIYSCNPGYTKFVLQHGFHAATTTTYTSTVKYSCNPGYTMFGECSITCLDTGNWSELLVNCTIKVLHNGFHNATSTTYNSTVIYSCNPGYTMFGENSITCNDTGNWNKLLVNCTIKGTIRE
ncbi:hypothetical protein DPMN_050553 [Dreissena polymorpha]|uniref:Sushi domain-containing protein n=1 Tax=Dreissena polymorpha TaxID=45954 RepID=A0A9D4CI32_DREPO|nr:hypothetical protein DPMN_050553 [Dreissena polymorpha]